MTRKFTKEDNLEKVSQFLLYHGWSMWGEPARQGKYRISRLYDEEEVLEFANNIIDKKGKQND